MMQLYFGNIEIIMRSHTVVKNISGTCAHEDQYLSYVVLLLLELSLFYKSVFFSPKKIFQ